MYNFIVILILIVSIVLALVVLVQNSKGGGLAANFSAPTQVMGVRQTADFLEKATWWLAGLLVALSLVATFSISSTRGENSNKVEIKQTNNATVPQTNNANTAQLPVSGQPAAGGQQ